MAEEGPPGPPLRIGYTAGSTRPTARSGSSAVHLARRLFQWTKVELPAPPEWVATSSPVADREVRPPLGIHGLRPRSDPSGGAAGATRRSRRLAAACADGEARKQALGALSSALGARHLNALTEDDLLEFFTTVLTTVLVNRHELPPPYGSPLFYDFLARHYVVNGEERSGQARMIGNDSNQAAHPDIGNISVFITSNNSVFLRKARHP